MSNVSHLESAIDGTRLVHTELRTLHEGRPLWIRYDLDAVAATMSNEVVAAQKYVEVIGAEALPALPDPVDWEAFASDAR